MRWSIAALAALVCGAVHAQSYRVGVFDVRLTGGQGASSEGFLAAFEGMPGYEAEALDGLELGVLLQYDTVILYDMHKPGRVVDDWRQNLERFVRGGGSVLSIYHQHLFPTIGPGVLKVYVREVRPVGGHAVTEGIGQFRTAWSDHIILRPGNDATVFLENTDGQPVAAYGPFGKGKLIDCGLALGISRGWSGSRAPEGMEAKLLANMLEWLRPEERWHVRLAAADVLPVLEASIGSSFVRQPGPVVLRVKAMVSGPGQAGRARLVLVGPGEERTESPESLDAQPVAGAEVGKVEVSIRMPTDGLASGSAKATYTAQAEGREVKGEADVRLVRAEPPEKEFRAFWYHAREDRLPVDVMPRMKACGFNAVIPRSSGGTGAFYLSKVLPDVQNILGEEDWLQNCIEHAHRNGIQVHPYRNCFVMEGRAKAETIAEFRADGRLQVAPDGRPLDWMCPSQEVNRRVELAAATEFVRDYDVEGFQYDFIRYPNSQGCFCDRCREKFEGERGERVESWPEDVVEEGKLFGEYTKFRQTQITDTVKMVSAAIREIGREVKISAAVFRDYARDSVSVGQDWVTWAKEGYIDLLCPMDYTNDVEMLDTWVRDQVGRVGEDVPVCAGLGLAASNSRMKTPEDMALQIDIARQAGCKGFALFAWYPGCDEKVVLPQRDDSLAGSPPVPWD
ncbi:MAG: family 10 glycosylhydrolase [Armatimonadota bacterium]|jgi:uncharacterized lipoprotein YddW (UPF0748 family)